VRVLLVFLMRKRMHGSKRARALRQQLTNAKQVFWNNDVLQNLDGVLIVILRELTKRESPSPQPSP